jgi:hypothetical protein
LGAAPSTIRSTKPVLSPFDKLRAGFVEWAQDRAGEFWFKAFS